LGRVARRFLIRGEVQGVGYRFFAEGAANSVEEFKHDLATGPQWAVVSQVEEISLEPTGRYSAFRVER
jgi:acylphosphatase